MVQGKEGRQEREQGMGQQSGKVPSQKCAGNVRAASSHGPAPNHHVSCEPLIGPPLASCAPTYCRSWASCGGGPVQTRRAAATAPPCLQWTPHSK